MFLFLLPWKVVFIILTPVESDFESLQCYRSCGRADTGADRKHYHWPLHCTRLLTLGRGTTRPVSRLGLN